GRGEWRSSVIEGPSRGRRGAGLGLGSPTGLTAPCTGAIKRERASVGEVLHGTELADNPTGDGQVDQVGKARRCLQLAAVLQALASPLDVGLRDAVVLRPRPGLLQLVVREFAA